MQCLYKLLVIPDCCYQLNQSLFFLHWGYWKINFSNSVKIYVLLKQEKYACMIQLDQGMNNQKDNYSDKYAIYMLTFTHKSLRSPSGKWFFSYCLSSFSIGPNKAFFNKKKIFFVYSMRDLMDWRLYSF